MSKRKDCVISYENGRISIYADIRERDMAIVVDDSITLLSKKKDKTARRNKKNIVKRLKARAVEVEHNKFERYVSLSAINEYVKVIDKIQDRQTRLKEKYEDSKKKYNKILEFNRALNDFDKFSEYVKVARRTSKESIEKKVRTAILDVLKATKKAMEVEDKFDSMGRLSENYEKADDNLNKASDNLMHWSYVRSVKERYAGKRCRFSDLQKEHDKLVEEYYSLFDAYTLDKNNCAKLKDECTEKLMNLVCGVGMYVDELSDYEENILSLKTVIKQLKADNDELVDTNKRIVKKNKEYINKLSGVLSLVGEK